MTLPRFRSSRTTTRRVSGDQSRTSVLLYSGAMRAVPAVHPGEILLEDFLEPLDMSAAELASTLHVPTRRITAIVRGKRPVDGEVALRLSRWSGTAAEFWMGLQQHYDLRVARAKLAGELRRIRPRRKSSRSRVNA